MLVKGGPGDGIAHFSLHNNVIKRKHFPRWFPAQRPVTRSFDVFIDLRLNKHGWENNCDVGDLKRHYVHYDVSVGVQAAIVL